ncbi:hypothetical protein RHMOL_Rhmol04G0011900 [Rhododendron molle]|uniref:Uncharacterized protein n=1 Tax=Rhododendron molle TaxID=49168 RepID=A0ACC0NVX1_RHOML|nr:hypothetical protein RHMOL_Rhmol04G0011900 [Rhododendron molle]
MSTDADFLTDPSSIIELFMIIIHHPRGHMVRSAPSQEHFKLLKFIKLKTERRTERGRSH